MTDFSLPLSPPDYFYRVFAEPADIDEPEPVVRVVWLGSNHRRAETCMNLAVWELLRGELIPILTLDTLAFIDAYLGYAFNAV